MQSIEKLDDAMKWIARLAEPYPSAETWAEFSDWLADDPANALAYHELAIINDELATSQMTVAGDFSEPARNDIAVHDAVHDNDNEPSLFSRYWAGGMMAAAASAALVLLGVSQYRASGAIETFSTRAGEHRQIALNDGSTITLNGGSRLTLDRSQDRRASLEAGEAIFTIRHDPSNPFRLRTAAGEVTDVGTVFNVRLDDRGIAVAVREGSVRFGSRREAPPVRAGYTVTAKIGGQAVDISRTDIQAIGGWQTGVLDYKQARLSSVALDLSRSLGVSVKVADNIAERRFTGIIQTKQDQKQLFRSLESLLGANATLTKSGWTLTH